MGWRPPRWTHSLPLVDRRIRALNEIDRLSKGERPLNPVSAAGRTFTTTFWGTAWGQNLERYSDFINRLPRARTYLRAGAVIDLQVEPGLVSALVSGTEVYRVTVEMDPISRPKWRSILRDCGGAVDSMVELLQGDLSGAVMARICREKGGLFPSPQEISCDCTCPDWASMCKHVAAALYGVGVRLDAEPGLLFKLRGVDPADLIAHAEAKLVDGTCTCNSRRVLRGDDLSELFGVEILQADPAADPAPSGTPDPVGRPVPAVDRARIRELESHRRTLEARIALVDEEIARKEAWMARIIERGLARLLAVRSIAHHCDEAVFGKAREIFRLHLRSDHKAIVYYFEIHHPCPSTNRTASIPTSRAMTKIAAEPGAIASAAKPGPGHSPAMPHPIPNSADPPTRRAVRSLRSGSEKPSAKIGRAIRRWMSQATAMTSTAPPITKASVGSQFPNRSRNPRTRAGSVMPPMVSPAPKIVPEASGTRISRFMTAPRSRGHSLPRRSQNRSP